MYIKRYRVVYSTDIIQTFNQSSDGACCDEQNSTVLMPAIPGWIFFSRQK